VPVFAWGNGTPPANGVPYTVPAEIAAVARLEDQLRQAASEPAILERILSDDFYETMPDGTGRDKSALIRAFNDGHASGISATRVTARLATNAVIVTADQDAGKDGAFTHVYVRDAEDWKLLSSTWTRR
jgi:hypothetical protein